MNLELGNNIKYLRRRKNMTQEQLGNLLQVTKVSICCYENGARVPSLDTLIKLADIFEVGLDELVRGKVK